MACPGVADVSAVALDPPDVLENVDATVGVSLPPGAGTSFVNFIALGGDCCNGATSAGPTEGGEVSSDGTVLVNMPAGYYKACISLGKFAFSDDEYTALATPLRVTVTRPPPPPPFTPPPSPPLPPPPGPPPCAPPFAPPGKPPAIPPLFGVKVEIAECILELGGACITFSTLIIVVAGFISMICLCTVAKKCIPFIIKNRITPGCAPPPPPAPLLIAPAPSAFSCLLLPQPNSPLCPLWCLGLIAPPAAPPRPHGPNAALAPRGAAERSPG